MDVMQCVNRLEGLGFAFSLNEDGRAVVKQPPEKNPAADNLIAWLRANKSGLREYLAERKPEQQVMELVGVDEAKARDIADLIDDGKAVLAEKVRYHTRTDTYDIRYREVSQ